MILTLPCDRSGKADVAETANSYNAYSNDINQIRPVGASGGGPQSYNLLDLDLMDGPAPQTQPQPQIDVPTAHHTMGVDSLAQKLGQMGVERTTSAKDLVELAMGTAAEPNYVPPKQQLLVAANAKGMEISGTFARRSGRPVFEMSITNRALQPLSDFAMQFNRNSYVLWLTVG